MKMSYTTPNGRLKFELDAKDGVQAFEIVYKVGLMFEQDECGCCKSKNVGPEVRRPKGYVYYSIKCRDCGAELQLHQHKAENGGGFYIARGDYPDSNGWGVWSGDGDQPDAAPSRGQTYQPRQNQPQQQRAQGTPPRAPQRDDEYGDPDKVPF